MTATTERDALAIRAADRDDCGLIVQFIRELAEYEELADEVSARPEQIEKTLFGEVPGAEVVIADWRAEPAGFALFFDNFSTFLARPGIYLEDLFVRPAFRGHGIGTALLRHLAALVVKRGGNRLDWSVLDWNRPAIEFYRSMGARAMEEWLPMRLEGEALRRLAQAQ